MNHVRRFLLGLGVLLVSALVAALLIGMLWGVNWLISQNPQGVAILLIAVLVSGFAYWLGFTLQVAKHEWLPALISVVGVLAIIMVMLATTILPR